jgi:hypothetical protein
MAEPDLEAAGAAIRALNLDGPTPVAVLRDRNRRRRARHRALGVGALVVVLIGAGLLLAYRPNRARVVTTSPNGTVPLVRLPTVEHPSRWLPIDYGRLQMWLPPGWRAISGSLRCTTRSDDNLITLGPTLQPCGISVASDVSLRQSTKPAPVTWRSMRIHGVTVHYHDQGRSVTYAVPSLQVTITASGTRALAVVGTLSPSPLDAVMEMTGAVGTPASWKAVRFDGFEIRVPRNWKTAPLTADCGALFVAAKHPAAYTGQALYRGACKPILLTYLLRPGNGVWLQQVSEQTAGTGRYRLKFHHLGLIVDPATSALGGQEGVPIANITAVAGTHTLSAQLGLGTDPAIAEEILSSLRYVGLS